MRRIGQIIFFCSAFLFANQAVAQQNIDSLQLLMRSAASDTQRLDLLHKLSIAWIDHDLDTALITVDRGIALADKTHDQAYIARFLDQKGTIYQMQSEYIKAHDQFDNALKSLDNEGHEAQYAEILCDKALTFQFQGMLDKCIETYMQAVEVYEAAHNDAGVGLAYAGIADCLFFKEDYAEGADYGERAIVLLKQANSTDGLLKAYDATSSNYLGINNNEKAFEMMDQAVTLAIAQHVGYLELASLINSRGNALKFLGRYDEAIRDYTESNKAATQLGHPGGMSATLANIADVYVRMADYEKALPYERKAMDIAEENGFNANLMEGFKTLSTIYKKLGDYRNALLYQEKLFDLRDSMMSVEKNTISEELRTKYETEKKEATIVVQEQKLSQQQRIQFLMIGGFILLALMLLQTYRNYRIKKKSGEQLAEANILLKKKNNENELLLKEIHHRVKNNLQIVSSLLYLQSDNIQDPAALDAVGDSQHRVRSMALIHQKLYLNKNLAAIEMHDYFETMGEAIFDSFGNRATPIRYVVEMDRIELDIDTAIPIGLIVNELITNSLKHAFPDGRQGQVTVGLSKSNTNELILYVADNGIPDGNGTSGTGFGSQLVEILATQLRGRVEKTVSHGTQISLRFPVPEMMAA